MQRSFGVQSIRFYDPTFGVQREHVLELCDALLALDEPVEWTCFSRTDLWDQVLLKRMHQAGCRSLLFGVESGNEEVLARTKKGIRLPQTEQFVGWCREIGIDTVASFIIGLPLETPEKGIERPFSLPRDSILPMPSFIKRAFFEHDDWQALGTVSGSWEETSASLNGLAYVPNGFTQRGYRSMVA